MDTSSTLVISIVIIGFFTFQLLFHFVSSWFSAKVSPGFNNLNFKKKIEWNSRVVSTCHSLVVGVVGLYIFWFDEATIADPLWGDPSFVKRCMPTTSYWWFFEALSYPRVSKAYVINGVLMTAVFFVMRIASIPPLYAYIYSVLGTEAYRRLGALIQCSWISSCVVLDVMNVMWMVKISKGCIKVISLFRQEKARRSLQNGKLD